MHNLSNEILINIFLQNNMSDWLNIELCCHKFYNIINDNYLISNYHKHVVPYLDNMSIWKNKKNMNTFVAKIENALRNNPTYTSVQCVKYISYTKCITDDYIITHHNEIFNRDSLTVQNISIILI